MINGKKVAVIMPAYNERDTIQEVVKWVLDTERVSELIIVDDGSTDGTRDLYEDIEQMAPDIIRVILHKQNQGKGGALRTGIAAATKDIVIIQDADLEYDPRDYKQMFGPHARFELIGEPAERPSRAATRDRVRRPCATRLSRRVTRAGGHHEPGEE